MPRTRKAIEPQRQDPILYTVQNDVEFFTEKATGESGVSVRGVAILAGVTNPSITKLLTAIEAGKAYPRLKPLEGQPLFLETPFVKNGGIVKAVRAEVVAKVLQYYAFEGIETAQYSLDKFAAAGITHWIHAITGWQKDTPLPLTPAPSTQETLAVDDEILLVQGYQELFGILGSLNDRQIALAEVLLEKPDRNRLNAIKYVFGRKTLPKQTPEERRQLLLNEILAYAEEKGTMGLWDMCRTSRTLRQEAQKAKKDPEVFLVELLNELVRLGKGEIGEIGMRLAFFPSTK